MGRREARRLVGDAGSLRVPAASLIRTFTNIDLTGFTLLSVGTTAAFTPPKKTIYFPADFPGIRVTQFDPLATFPIIQLPGLSSTTAAAIVLGIIIIYYVFTLLAPLPSLPLSRRVAPISNIDRIDEIEQEVEGIIRRTGESTEFLEDAAFRRDRDEVPPTEYNSKFYRNLWPMKKFQKKDEQEDKTKDDR